MLEENNLKATDIATDKDRITKEDATVCTDFFDRGAVVSRTGDQVVMDIDGETVTVTETTGKGQERLVLPWDDTHDDDSLDDLTLINAFSEAPLLRTLQRRFLDLDNVRIYTYVGDILIALNPYMMIPSLVNIPEDELVQYQPQHNPHTYVLPSASLPALDVHAPGR